MVAGHAGKGQFDDCRIGRNTTHLKDEDLGVRVYFPEAVDGRVHKWCGKVERQCT